MQIPWEMQGRTSAQMKVSVGDISSALYGMPLSDYSPGIFGATDAAGAAITTDNPARRGQTITISANGLGAVNNQPASGFPAQNDLQSTTKTVPTVTIGGKTVTVNYSGLEPGDPAEYRIDVVIPSAGGAGKVPGDYVYRSWTADQFQAGFWGIFRVGPPAAVAGTLPDTVAVTRVGPADGGKFMVSGHVTVVPAQSPAQRIYASELQLKADGIAMQPKVQSDGRWSVVLDKEPTRIVAPFPGPGGPIPAPPGGGEAKPLPPG